MVKHYILRATKDTQTAHIHFHANNDAEAIADAAIGVVKQAYPNREPWATGFIELINEIGVVLKEMYPHE